MSRLRIGINGLYLIPGGVGGTETYLRNLLKALAELDSENLYFVYVARDAADVVPDQANFAVRPQLPFNRFRPIRLLWEQTVLPLQALADRLDVLLNAGFTAPAVSPCPQLTLFHDLQHKLCPENFRWFDLPFWNLFLWIAERRSRRILVTGETNAADLSRFYGTPGARLGVTPLGVAEEFRRIAARRAPQDFLFIVSTLHPHKNYRRALEAWALYHRRRPEYKLVIAGLRGFESETVERAREELGLRDSVAILGWIPQERLLELYATARAFLYPSTFEGFGLPVLEAMAAGLPVACSDIPPLRNLASGAAILFDPQDTEAIGAAISAVMDNQPTRDRLSDAGPRRAASFSWRSTAERTLRYLTDAARERAG